MASEEGVHENPLQRIFVGLLRVAFGVETLPRFPQAFPIALKGIIFCPPLLSGRPLLLISNGA